VCVVYSVVHGCFRVGACTTVVPAAGLTASRCIVHIPALQWNWRLASACTQPLAAMIASHRIQQHWVGVLQVQLHQQQQQLFATVVEECSQLIIPRQQSSEGEQQTDKAVQGCHSRTFQALCHTLDHASRHLDRSLELLASDDHDKLSKVGHCLLWAVTYVFSQFQMSRWSSGGLKLQRPLHALAW
jgi:hypothetical protein